MTSWPRAQVVELDLGADVDAQLAAAGEDVDGAVVVALEEDAEAGRRLRQPVDLLLERHDLVAGLAQGRREALVLGGDGRQRPLGVGEPQLETAGLRGRVGQAAPQVVTSASRNLTCSASSRALRTAPLEAS